MVAGCAPDIFQVVVLSAHTQAFLGGGGSFCSDIFLSEKNIFKLHHSRVAEKQTGVVVRDERRRVYSLVAVFFKIS